jgi:hypothetical protein
MMDSRPTGSASRRRRPHRRMNSHRRLQGRSGCASGQVIHTPGHTQGSVCLHFARSICSLPATRSLPAALAAPTCPAATTRSDSRFDSHPPADSSRRNQGSARPRSRHHNRRRTQEQPISARNVNLIIPQNTMVFIYFHKDLQIYLNKHLESKPGNITTLMRCK